MNRKKKRYAFLSKKLRCVNILECLETCFQRNRVLLLKEVHEHAKLVTYFQLRFTLQKNGVRTRSSGKHAYEKHKL